MILDGFAPSNAIEDVTHLGAPVGRDDDIDARADLLRRGIPEQAFGRGVPAGDGAVERFGDDGVIR